MPEPYKYIEYIVPCTYHVCSLLVVCGVYLLESESVYTYIIIRIFLVCVVNIPGALIGVKSMYVCCTVL